MSRGTLAVAAKAAGSVAILAILAWSLDLEDALARIGAVAPVAVVLAVLALSGQALTAGWRWSWLNRRAGLRLGIGATTKILYAGLLFNQVLPSAIGGDALRILLLARAGAGAGWAAATASVLADRALGLLALVASAAIGVAALAGAAMPPGATTVIGGLSALAWAAIVWLILARGWLPRPPWMPGRLLVVRDRLAQVFRDRRAGAGLIAGSLAVHAWSVIAMLALAWGLGLAVPLLALAAILPPVFLAMAVPVSLAGWGVREALLVLALGGFGVPAPAAVALSVLFGLCQALAALPGALWAWQPQRRDP